MRSFGHHLQLVHSAWDMPRVEDRVSANFSMMEPIAAWRNAAQVRLEQLIRLANGWDGYIGMPVGFSNAFFAMSMLESVCADSTEPPQIVPGASGDLQVEWHTLYGDVELHVMAPNKVHAWYSKIGGGEQEIDLTNDFRQVASWIKDIMEPPIAVAAAAA